MTSKTKTEIKAFFETGDQPTESQFIDLIDSYVDKSGPLGVLETDVSGGSSGLVAASAGDLDILSAAQSLSRLGITVSTTALAVAAVAPNYTTTAQATALIAVSAFATTAQATAGTATGVAMNPVLVKNAIESLAFTSAAYATTAQAEAGTNAATVMNPVLTKNAIAALATGVSGGLTQIETATPSGVATSDTASIPQTYRGLLMQWSGISCDTASRAHRIDIDDGGGFGDTFEHGYIKIHTATTVAGATTAGTPTTVHDNVFTPEAAQAAAATESGSLLILPYQANGYKFFMYTAQQSSGGVTTVFGVLRTTASITKIRHMWSGSGNFDAGSWTLYGIN